MAKNITLAIDETLLDKVRVLAAMKRTSVNELVRSYLQRLVDQAKEQDEARIEQQRLVDESEGRIEPSASKVRRRRLLDAIDTSVGGLGPGYKWNREELYEERLRPRHERPDLCGDGDRQ